MFSLLCIIIALLFVILCGIADAAQTARKDLGTDSPIYDWLKSQKLKDWYRGGNAKYNPAFPSFPFFNFYQADFWHTMKFGWIWGYAFAIAFASMADLTVWQAAIVGIFAQGIEGETFRIFYGNVFRKEPKDSIWKILSEINPFINTHTHD